MAEYKYVDWPGLQYYHGKVTELIDSRLRQCIRFGEDTLYVDLDSPDTNDLNIVIRVLDSFTVRPSDDWFDETLWNNTYPAGTLLQVVQKPSGVVYTVFIQPATNSGGGGSDTPIDLSNYYTIEEVNAKIVDALKPYATIEFVTVKLEANQSLLAAHIDEFGKLTTRVAEIENTLTTQITPTLHQLEDSITKIADQKADKSDIPSLEGYATESFVAAKIAEAELAGGDVDLSGYYTKEEIDAKGFATEEYVQSVMDDADVVGMDARITELENQSTSVDTRLNEIEDQADENSASLTALDGEIDRIDAAILTMDTQIINISQNLADLQAYGTF